MTEMLHRFLLILTEEDGANSIEYSLLAALVALVIVLALSLIGSALDSIFNVAVAGLNGS